jgi:dolichyl-phosphate beta-glucosyltransferase
LGKKIFRRIIDKKFAHDIEIVLLAKKYKIEIIELPVKWTHKAGSKIHVITDGLKILIALIKMKSLTYNFK